MINFRSISIASLIAFSLASPVEATEKLRLSTPIPASHPLMTKVLKPWAANVKEVTEGRVVVRIMPKIVGSYAGQFDVAATGQADISMGNQSYSPGRFKQYAFAELPGLGDRAEATSVAFWDTYNQYFGPKDEMAEVKVLSLYTAGPGQLFTTEHVVSSMDGNKGVKVRGGGEAATRVVDTLGMTSIQAPFSKAAEMISNGVVDGAMLERSLVPVFGFDRYFKNRFVYPGGLFNVSYFMVMNKKSWAELDPKDQAAIDAISGQVLAQQFGQVWDEIGVSADKAFLDSGMLTTAAEGPLKENLAEAFKAYEKTWIDSVSADGFDGQEIIDSYRALVNEIEQGL
ncbi:TRAP transporter substrate-binding protein [Granulosicoccus antarcticus]|uniref:Outer membrane transporter protein TsaT n=1 Tax=Granulosicoccus antarcticus IMCC3135 TaxID=1192854 RepID=A0A2Z2NJQ1_9GAMM|nr:TRAP transporter substrate-binding protein [Granulosicoccus antarcticus]ASJ70301.1 Outer membrane transporter protein TsaT [Granulosicoccus antarcticus IMCC3135]